MECRFRMGSWAAWSIVLATLGAGCGEDQADTDTTASLGTGTGATTTGANPATTGAGTGGQVMGDDCPWVGIWIADLAHCGDDPEEPPFEFWFELYDETRLDITHAQTAGCDIVVSWTNSSCSEEEVWFADPKPSDDLVTFESDGITSCVPESCLFSATDSPCVIGDRQVEVTVGVEQREDALVFSNLMSYAAPTCSDVLRLRFARE